MVQNGIHLVSRIVMLAGLLPLLLPVPSSAHDVPVTPVIVDSDCAPDDLRALCLLLSMPEIEVRALIASDGACAPAVGAEKMRALRAAFERRDIPVAIGSELLTQASRWRPMAEAIPWGETGSAQEPAAEAGPDLLQRLAAAEKQRITVICLGSLDTVAACLERDPSFAGRIARIVWYNEDPSGASGSNAGINRAAAARILASPLRLDVVASRPDARFDASLLALIAERESSAAKVVTTAFRSPAAKERMATGHYGLWDDLIPVFLRAPELFTISKAVRDGVRAIAPIETAAVREHMLKLYEPVNLGDPHEHLNVIFQSFPLDPILFRLDLRGEIGEIIRRHGEEEWRLGALAGELHRHLGIYAIAGVKMGLRAREIFGVGPDELIVVSRAGQQPPVSCLNDGLQVSTGATLGHGLITVPQTESPLPEAEFTHGARTIRLKLRPEYGAQVRADIVTAIRDHGNLSPSYWNAVRRLAIRYWRDWDRHEMFELIEVGK